MAIRPAESALRKRIRKWLSQWQTVYQFWPVQRGYGRKTVDLLACVDGAFFAIEVKDTGKEPTELQHDIIYDVVEAKGNSFWCDSWESFYEQFSVHVRERGLRLIPKAGTAIKDS